ncbi:MAG: GNAT family N-acetyltransferase [Acidimicrobiales bacterium]
MAEPYVRLLHDDEMEAGARLVATAMLGSLRDDVMSGWTAMMPSENSHGAFTADGRLVGLARWFADEVAVPGGDSLGAAGVTAVAVLPTHRRQGHLRRLMGAQLDQIAAAGVPVALLVAAEWPIYGRFGYGPAMDACAYEVDATAARFRDAPSGDVELVTPAELLPHLEAAHAARWARSPGSLRRETSTWERAIGLISRPGDTSDLGLRRGALWRDDEGVMRGALSYTVTDDWVRNRPSATAEALLLVGETPEAERELWRHLCDLDWVTTVKGPLRAVDDPLPLFLSDGRAAAQVDRSDAIWARLLDVPAAFTARRSSVPGAAVIEVEDHLGYGAGRWAIEVGPDAGSAALTDRRADVRMSIAALGSLYFGGHTARRLADAGWIHELEEGAVDRVSAVLATPAAPWSTTSF